MQQSAEHALGPEIFNRELSRPAAVRLVIGARGVEFAEVNLSKDPAGRMELVQKTGMMSFPQVLVGDELIGGFAELQAVVDSGRLDELLAM